MPWYRTSDGQGVYHALIRGKDGPPARCQAPRLDGDNAEHGETCGRSGGKLCDGPRGPWSKLGSNTCDLPICDQHATHVEGQDLDYCPTHKHLAAPPAEPEPEHDTPVACGVVRHKWQKLRLHVYICWKCGCGRVNACVKGQWQTTFHRPDGTSVVSAHVPPCEVGSLTQKYLARYSDQLHDPVPPARTKEASA